MMKNNIQDNSITVFWDHKPISASRYGKNRETGGAYYRPSYKRFRDFVDDWVEENTEWVDNASEMMAQFNAFSISINASFQIQNPYLWGLPHTKFPDEDNILKAVQDEISGALGIKDMRFYQGSITKRYAEKDSISFVISGEYIDFEAIKKLHSPKKKTTSKRKTKTDNRPRFKLSENERKGLI